MGIVSGMRCYKMTCDESRVKSLKNASKNALLTNFGSKNAQKSFGHF